MVGQELLDLFIIGKEMQWRYKLDRYEQSAIQELIKIYENAKIDIRRQIQAAPDYVRQEAIMQHIEEMLTGLRTQAGMAITEMATLAATQALFEYQDLLSVGGRVTNFNFVSLTKEQVAAFVEEPVGGQLLTEWLQDSFDSRVLDHIREEVGTGLAKGSGFREIVERIFDQSMNMSRDDAISIARTYVQSVNSRAQEQVYRANSDIVKKVKWCASFENSKKSKGLGTCLRCAALDGQEWPIKAENKPPMPLHIRCRCTWLPVTVTYRELGLDIDELEDAARPYTIRKLKAIDEGGTRKIEAVGQHQGDWASWLETRSKKFQLDALGPGRYELWQSGKVSLHDMVDRKTGRLLTLKELLR